MHKGMYTALSGAVLRAQQMDIISGNVTNVSTVAYKKDRLSFRSYLMSERLSPLQQAPSLYPESRAMSVINKQGTDMSEGEVYKTGNPMNVALRTPGFGCVIPRLRSGVQRRTQRYRHRPFGFLRDS